MVSIFRNWWLLKDKLYYFATEKEIQRLVSELSWNEILRIQHAPVDLSQYNRMVYKGVFRTRHIDLNKDIEQIFSEMKKISRREIRRAEDMSSDIEVRVNDDRAQKDFLTVYNEFVQQSGHARQLSPDQYEDFLKIGDVFVLYFKGKPYAASLDVSDYSTKKTFGAFLGSKRLNQEDAQFSSYLNRYLYWYEIQTYKEKGFEIYDMGGGGETGPRSWFKQSLGGNTVEVYSYIFAGSMVTYLFSKAVMTNLNLINKIRAWGQNILQGKI